jgi:hypothetical protein
LHPLIQPKAGGGLVKPRFGGLERVQLILHRLYRGLRAGFENHATASAIIIEQAHGKFTRYDRTVGRTLILIGIVLVVLGLLVTLGERLPVRFGRLPGDIVIRGKNGAFYFPVVTCLLLSLVLSLVMWLLGRR